MAVLVLAAFVLAGSSEPVVITGEMVPRLLGVRISDLRMMNAHGVPIPFQVDEITRDGEYVCDRGEKPNLSEGNGVLDSIDEIAFLSEDASPVSDGAAGVAPVLAGASRQVDVRVRYRDETRAVLLSSDRSLPRSDSAYVSYDHSRELIKTPYYFSQFGRKRFHFTRAGIAVPGGGYVELTKELRIRIRLRALGLFTVEYNEENMVCVVKRYKVGPIRLIRRGDFHLNLGLWVKGSHAAVNQICYPQAVGVPVHVHLPVRLRMLFGEAYIEMTPVMAPAGAGYVFDVPHRGISIALAGKARLDTLIRVLPNNEFFAVHDQAGGFGWLLRATTPDEYLDGSGYVVKRPSDRGGIAHCGFRLNVRDLPRGYYLITNWVVFSRGGVAGLGEAGVRIASPASVWVDGRKVGYNAITHLRSSKQ